VLSFESLRSSYYDAKFDGSWSNRFESTGTSANKCMNESYGMKRYVGIDTDGYGGFGVLDVLQDGTMVAQCFSVSNGDACGMDVVLGRFLPQADLLWIERPFHQRGKGMVADASQERGKGLWKGLVFKK